MTTTDPARIASAGGDADLAAGAALIADPARARVLLALCDSGYLTRRTGRRTIYLTERGAARLQHYLGVDPAAVAS